MEQLKTGTTTLGLVCKDGLVLAADRRATAGYMIADKHAQKVHIINDNLALTIAGTVSDVQLLIKYLRAELKLKDIRTGRLTSIKEAANLLASMVYGNIRKMSMIPGISHFVIGGFDSEGYHLYDLYPDGALSEVDDYVSSGSGSVFVYGVLESQYKKGLLVHEGVELAKRAVEAALQRDAASGNGIDVITITSKGIAKAFEQELTTRFQ